MRLPGLFLSLTALLAACGISAGDVILEHKDVARFQATPRQEGGETIIKISGLAMHSSLAVQEMKLVTHGDELQANLHLVPARAGLSGSFNYDIRVPAGIRKVVFGPSKHPIWP